MSFHPDFLGQTIDLAKRYRLPATGTVGGLVLASIMLGGGNEDPGNSPDSLARDHIASLNLTGAIITGNVRYDAAVIDEGLYSNRCITSSVDIEQQTKTSNILPGAIKLPPETYEAVEGAQDRSWGNGPWVEIADIRLPNNDCIDDNDGFVYADTSYVLCPTANADQPWELCFK